MIKAVIFDMDGVLVDSHGVFNKLFTQIVKKELGLNISEKEFARYPGMRFEQRIEIIGREKGFHLSSKKVEAAIEKGRVDYYKIFLSSVKLFSGVLDLLDQLRNAGIKIALGTNGSRIIVEKLLNLMKINKYFSSIVTFDDVSSGKPAPEIFLKNAYELNLKPEECIVIDDAVEGIEAAHAAGMKVISVATTQSEVELKKAELVVKTIKDINIKRIKKL